jgi:hypothetical protein
VRERLHGRWRPMVSLRDPICEGTVPRFVVILGSQILRCLNPPTGVERRLRRGGRVLVRYCSTIDWLSTFPAGS